MFKTNGRKLEADKADIEAKYAKVLKQQTDKADKFEEAVAAAKVTKGVAAATEKALEKGKIQTSSITGIKAIEGDNVHTKASEDLAKSIVDEATAEKAGYGDAYKAAAKKVEEYINAGVTWTELHIVLA